MFEIQYVWYFLALLGYVFNPLLTLKTNVRQLRTEG